MVDLDGAKGFVIADIPGLIEGASEGVGLGLEFLRHIERTKVMIHMVDAAGTEEDPVADIIAINKELEAYDPALLKKPQVIAANKMDAVYGDENEIIQKLKDTFEKDGIRVFPISAVSGKGLKELLYCVSELSTSAARSRLSMSLNSIRHSVSLRMSHTRLRWLTTVHSLWKDRRSRRCLAIRIWIPRIPFLPEVHEGAGHFKRPGGTGELRTAIPCACTV